MPCCVVTQERKSTRILKSLRAILRQNGRQVSIYIDCFHSIVRRCLFAGWAESKQNACLISTFAKRVSSPLSIILVIAPSTVTYLCEAIQVFRGNNINTVKFGIWEINNQSPFTLLMTFGNYTKSANVSIRGGVLVIGSCYLITEHLSWKVIFDYLWVKESTFQVFVCTFSSLLGWL